MQIAAEPEMLYTAADAAKLLKTSKGYMYSLINAGLIKVLYLPKIKIRKSELERFLKAYEGYDLRDPNNPIKIDESKIIIPEEEKED